MDFTYMMKHRSGRNICYLSGGYRYDRADFKFKPSTPDSTTTEEHAFTAGINYNFLRKSYMYVSFARSFRYPVLDEFFNFFTKIQLIQASFLRDQTIMSLA